MKLTTLVGIFAILVVAVLVFPTEESKEDTKRFMFLSNLKRQASALNGYATDHDDRYPVRDLWTDASEPYLPIESGGKAAWSERCTSLPGDAYGHAFNATLAQARIPGRPETAILVYDSLNPIRNASDPLTSLPSPGRHRGKNHLAYAYADGHGRVVAP